MSLDNIKKDIQLGKIPEALAASLKFISIEPSNVSAWFILADLYLRTKQYPKALKAINSAEKLAPNQPQIIISKITCLIEIGENDHALSLALSLFSTKPILLAKDWLKLGVHLHQLNALNKAHHCFQEAVVLAPENSHYRFNLATSYRNTGHLEQAEIELNKTLEINPFDWDAYLARSLLKKVTIKSNHLAELTAKINDTKNKESQSKLLFAIAKEQEDCQAFNKSFNFLSQANDLRNQFTQYDVDTDVKTMSNIAKHFHFKHSETTKSSTNITPIFILGLPRTGTTLLERIITQHPDVFAAGELQNFSVCLTKAVLNSTESPPKNIHDFIKQSTKVDFKKLGESYLKSVSTHIGDNKVFIDKMPLNFLYVGLIQQAIPQAKIIHLTRSPMAACYAIYKTSFGQAYPFSYEFNNLAKYYVAYRQLMRHWKANFSENLLEVNYESLVTNSLNEAEKTFRFLNLTWDNEYLELSKNKQASATASSSQIRGEIYQSSIDMWQNYQEQLLPISETLKREGINPYRWE